MLHALTETTPTMRSLLHSGRAAAAAAACSVALRIHCSLLPHPTASPLLRLRRQA
jgi:hypothetical protein